jgi:hypothetical protein
MPYGMGSEIGWKEVEPMSKGAALAHLALMADEASRLYTAEPRRRKWTPQDYDNEISYHGFNSGENYVSAAIGGDSRHRANPEYILEKPFYLPFEERLPAVADATWPQVFTKYAMERELNNVPLNESPKELRKILAKQALGHLDRLKREVDMRLGDDYDPSKMSESDLYFNGVAGVGHWALQDSRSSFGSLGDLPQGRLFRLAADNPEQIVTGIPRYINKDLESYKAYTTPEAVARRTTLAHTMRSYAELLPIADSMGILLRDRAAQKAGYHSILTDDERLVPYAARLFKVLREMAETGQFTSYAMLQGRTI